MKRVLACLLALSLTLIFVACGDKPDDTTTTTTTEPTTAPGDTTPSGDDTTAPTEPPATDEDGSTLPTTTEAPATDASGNTLPTSASTAPSSTNPSNGQGGPTTPPPTTPPTKAPSTPAEILAYYNNATALVHSSKPAIKRMTKTVLKDDSIKGTTSGANFLIGQLMSFEIGGTSIRKIIGDFLNEGDEPGSNKKGEKPILYKATVGIGDIVGTPTLSTVGDNYVITFSLKGENNPQKGASAIGRVTDNYVTGEEAFKEIMNADTGGITVSVEKVDMVTSNVKVEATINKTTGRIVKVVHDNTFDATITKIKVSVLSVAGAQGQGTINAVYSDFVW